MKKPIGQGKMTYFNQLFMCVPQKNLHSTKADFGAALLLTFCLLCFGTLSRLQMRVMPRISAVVRIHSGISAAVAVKTNADIGALKCQTAWR